MMLPNCEIWYPKLVPSRPNARFNKANPTWEVQIRTTSKDQKREWQEANLNVAAVLPDDDTPPYWRVNIKRSVLKADGTESKEVDVIDGNLDPVDPGTIGNGSIANLRVFQYEYENDDGKGIATMLMGVQLTRHILYKPTIDPEDQFQSATTEVITPAEEGEEETSKGTPKIGGGTPSMGDNEAADLGDEVPF